MTPFVGSQTQVSPTTILSLNCKLACDIVFNHAKSGLVQAPPGTSIKMDSGVFVLQVHYDNTYHVPILNDNSGVSAAMISLHLLLKLC